MKLKYTTWKLFIIVSSAKFFSFYLISQSFIFIIINFRSIILIILTILTKNYIFHLQILRKKKDFLFYCHSKKYFHPWNNFCILLIIIIINSFNKSAHCVEGEKVIVPIWIMNVHRKVRINMKISTECLIVSTYSRVQRGTRHGWTIAKHRKS